MDHIQEEGIQNSSVEKPTEKIDKKKTLFQQLFPKKEKKDKEEIKSVSLRSLFRYATWIDFILILISYIAAIANGASFPLLMLLFGNVINTFTDHSFNLCSLNLTNISLQYCPSGVQLTSTNFYTSSSLCNLTDLNITNSINFKEQIQKQSLYMVALGCCMLLIGYFQISFSSIAAERQTRIIRQKLFRSIVNKEIIYFDMNKTGQLSIRLTDDINKIHDGIGDKPALATRYIASFISGLALSFSIGWKLTLVILSVSPVVFISTVIMSKLTASLTSMELKAYGKAGAVAEEVLSSIRIVLSYNGQEREKKRYKQYLNEAKERGIRKGAANGLSLGVLWFIFYCSYALGYWYGSKLIEHGEYDIGKVMIIFMTILVSVIDLGQASPHLQAVAQARTAASFVWNIIDEPSTIDSNLDEGIKKSDLIGNIKFSNVTFSYPSRSDIKILKNISFNVKQGETIALVGSSGSGKSTCIQLLQRFYDLNSGSILIDDNEINKYNLKWLRQNLGVVSQEPILFQTTIRENILFGFDKATDEEIYQAAKMANVHEFIMNLPQQYNTLIGERGATLSGGQKQRIAIARALIGDPKILLLDEATSALDNESETIVQDALDRASQGRTTIVIAHRLSTIRNADKIIVMQKGEIIEEGNHELLMNNQSIYYNLIQKQNLHNTQDKTNSVPEEENKQRRMSNLSLQSLKNNQNKEPEEINEKKKVRKNVSLQLLTMNKPEWIFILFGCIGCICNGVIQPTMGIVLSKLTAVFQECDKDSRNRKILLYNLIFIGSGIICFIATFIQSFFFGCSGEALTKRLRIKTFETLLRQDISYFDDPNNNTGALCTHLSTEASAVQGATGIRLGILLQSFCSLAGGLIIGFIFSWQLTLLIMAFIPLIMAGSFLESRLMTGFASKDKKALENAGKVIGIMAIEMAGGVYCPLSPKDPQHRLYALVQQTQSRLVLLHWLTKMKFDNYMLLIDIQSMLMNNDMENPVNVDQLSSITVTSSDIAYIIFTSGSTGIPKAIQARHENLIHCMNSLVKIDVLNKGDNVVQIARCSFDIHVQEIFGALMHGATLVMLHPRGTIDFDYLSNIVQMKQITYILMVPSLLRSFFTLAAQSGKTAASKYFRSLCTGGESVTVQLSTLIADNSVSEYNVWNYYGPAEITITCTLHYIDVKANPKSIPIGISLPNYRCLILNEFLQSTSVNQEGELFVGGAGVFSGYLGRDDLTAQALVEIDGEIFYRTGDLVTIDNNCLFHHRGRKDHQIKLRGQRIELGEIEQCLLNISSISASVVIKWNDDYLVAYVQSSHVNEEQLHQHCQSHLPPHMIPSFFIILDKLPLNLNDKIDRKRLPSPSFSSIHLTNSIELLLPTNDIEARIHRIWCEIFKLNKISVDTNIFTIGGHSLLIMQLFNRYKIEFHLEQIQNTLSISSLFQHPTIIHHAQLIQQSIDTIHTLDDYPWCSLHLTQARASFAQERIYLHEQICFSSEITMNNMYAVPFLYRISSMNDHISITRLYHAFQSFITKHSSLRTALYLDTNGRIIQHCLDTNIIFNHDMKSYGLTIINIHNDDHLHMNEIIDEILNQSDLFDLSKGHVVNCHILRHQQSNLSFTQNSDLLTKDDFILFTIHHAMFDGASTSIFLRDLSLAYQSEKSLPMDDNSLEYIDYSVHEHIIDMSLSREFWHSQLERYNSECSLSLPVDRQRSSTNQQRSGLASIAEIIFDNELCTSFLNYASSHHLTYFQLGISIFYVFLFKLTHGETDLCISSINANRYRSELVNMIGMFVSTLPCRVEIDSHWSFDEVVKYVQEKCLSILQHSHYPLQHILSDLHLTQSNVSFLETMFDFVTISNEGIDLSLNGVNLEQVSLNEIYEMAKFDFLLRFEYNPLSDNKRLSCRFVCSRDLFEKSTISKIAQRFQYMLEQVFQTQSSNIPMNHMNSSINKVCFILPEEAEEMELVVFHRLETIVNEAPASFAQARIWHDERIRFDPDKRQVAIYNMPFVYRLQPDHTLSIKQLRHALHLTLNKHPALHTSLHFDIKKNLLMQRVITHEDKNNNNNIFSIIESTYETDEQLNEILHDEKRNPHLFDLAQGLVFRCHLVYYKQISSNHLLSDRDLLIFNFHHALFDFPSMRVFHRDLNQAYTTGQLLYDDNTTLRYIDYAVIEQQMSMAGASMFWLDTLHDCKLDQSLPLPFDRYRLSNEHRTDRGTSISFDFGQDLSHDFLIYASSNNISLEQLALATYYVFLFKLTNGEKDLCIGINTHGRYRDELKSIIGMFVNAIPLRCRLDPQVSFHKLTKHVRDIMINCIKYSYFPLQRILNQHPNISNPVFLDTSFEFLSSMRRDEETEIIIGDRRFSLLPYSIKISEDEVMSKFDFILSFQHDPNLNEFSCTIGASRGLFNTETICIIAQRLQTMLHQQFTSFDCVTNKSIYELSLTLSNEQYLMQSLNHTQISFSSPLTCIHHEFVYQVMKHPQKLAVELDEQSLTYCELLYYVQVLSLTLISEYHVIPGEVVCQCVERSLSMVIGIMAIEMAGGVYCPLSPRDPQHRLYALVEQTKSRLVFVHCLTKIKFYHDIISLNIDLVLIINDLNTDMNGNCLSNVVMKGDEIAYIIFTSGSTGTPKAVQVRHKNFIDCIHSLAYINSLNKDDTVVQMTRCSFDIHVQEILGSLLMGSTLILLHPGGTTDFDYLFEVLNNRQITYLHTVPSLLHSFFIFIEQNKKTNAVKYLRSLCSIGEAFAVPLIELIVKIGITNYIVWNLYGPAETTIVSTFHRVDLIPDARAVSIGTPLFNYRCTIMNEYSQQTITNQEGELLIGGVGIFAGYLDRDDLTAKALLEIDGEIFYRTGDLVRMDSNGLLHYQGRKDHQIKLHGQRIELGEIERCLLTITSISTCVVMKWNDDYLVAYVQSSHMSEEQLRQYCQFHLPPHMIPSIFIILDKFPLNPNGKVDRKQLPSPDFSLSTLLSSDKSDTPLNQFEERIHTIWCQVLHCNENHISGTASFFSVGGHSLRFLELYYRYQSLFNFDAHSLSIGLFLQQPTIRQHAQLLQTLPSNDTQTIRWHTLHINQGKTCLN
ncbi:unnamed protein product [Adineta steineri]|uniref:Uncharacterized protein n=1 Tax=Adineta steineri TaxID=433720 RepID=A0A815L4R3_9BILA|nr:unnamed protein product [Adineta steineri]CAF1402868.1 unnamed protein product [Adineta steineri]